MIYLSQLAQALCVKTYVEELRRGENTFGMLTWQLNDVWQASSWGSLDYGGRWRALHHSMQSLLAPTLVSVWLDGATLRVYGSHHGTPAAAADRVEVNVTDIATGAVRAHHVVTTPPLARGSAVVQELLHLAMDGIDPTKEVITTRLLPVPLPDTLPAGTGATASAASSVETVETATVHPLLPAGGSDFASMAWVNVDAGDVALTCSDVTKANATVVVQNKAAAPLFYALVTSSVAGRFSHNLLMVPARSSRTVTFLFAQDKDDDAQGGGRGGGGGGEGAARLEHVLEAVGGAGAEAAEASLSLLARFQFQASLRIAWFNEH
jgi:beta-mannosidase